MFSAYNAPRHASRSPRVVSSLLALCCWRAVAASLPALATTYVPVSDQALIERAVVIGTFEVVSADLAPTAGLVTEYQMRVETLLKGELRSRHRAGARPRRRDAHRRRPALERPSQLPTR